MADRDDDGGPLLCEVPGCYRDVVGRGKGARICMACIVEGLAATPCKGCGGRIRRMDQTGIAKSRRGYCQTCRAEMPVPLSSGCWPKGTSGNPSGVRRRSDHVR